MVNTHTKKTANGKRKITIRKTVIRHQKVTEKRKKKERKKKTQRKTENGNKKVKRGVIEVKTNIGKNIKRKTDKRKHNGKQNTKGPFIFLWERWVLRFGVVSFGNDPPKPLLIFLILLE